MFTVVKLIFKDEKIDNKERLLFMEHFEGKAVISNHSFIGDVINSNLCRKIMPTSSLDKKSTAKIFKNILETINESKPIEKSYSINNLIFILLIEYKDSRFFKYFIFNDALILPRNNHYHFVCPSCNLDFGREIKIKGKNIDVEYNLIRGLGVCKYCGHVDTIESFIRKYSVYEYFIENNLE